MDSKHLGIGPLMHFYRLLIWGHLNFKSLNFLTPVFLKIFFVSKCLGHETKLFFLSVCKQRVIIDYTIIDCN